MAKKAGAVPVLCFLANGEDSQEETGLRNRSHLLSSGCLPCRRRRAAAVLSVHRNKIKCGEEKTPLVFGDIAIVIGGERGERERERTAPKICELVAKR